MRESEREGRQKGLAVNPVHGQSWRSLIFLPGWCRQNSGWITAPYFIALFKKASPSSFVCSDNLSEGLGSWVQKDQGTVDKEVGRQAWWQDVPWTVWCHTWINLFRGRRCMAVDHPLSLSLLGVWGRQTQNSLVDETHKIFSEVGIDWTHKQKGLTGSK